MATVKYCMENKIIDIEKNIYELLGIKTFKKLVFLLMKFVTLPVTIFLSKPQQEKFYSNIVNYRMKKGNGLQDLRSFKKWLVINASAHTISSLVVILFLLLIPSAPLTIIYNLILILLNMYCIILQRYNWIRINAVLKKGEPQENKQRKELVLELKNENFFEKEKYYNINIKKKKTFEEFLESATLQELKKFQKQLYSLKMPETQFIDKNKTLKLVK